MLWYMFIVEAVDYTLAIPFLYETLVGGSQTALPACGAAGAMQYLNIQFYSKTDSVRVPNIPNSFVSGSFYEIPFSVPYPGDASCLQFNDIPLTLVATCEITPVRGSPVYQYGYAPNSATPEISYLKADRIGALNSSAAFDVSWSASSGQSSSYYSPNGMSGSSDVKASTSPSQSSDSSSYATNKLETLVIVLIALVAILILVIVIVASIVGCIYLNRNKHFALNEDRIPPKEYSYDQPISSSPSIVTPSLFSRAYKSWRSNSRPVVYPGYEESNSFNFVSSTTDSNGSNRDIQRNTQAVIVSPSSPEECNFGVFEAYIINLFID